MNVQQTLQQAVQHHERGELAQAERLYRQALAREPNNFDALSLLAVLATQAGHPQAAIELLRRAESIRPGDPRIRAATAEAYSTLGDQLSRLRKLPESIDAYRTALSLHADMPEAANNLGLVLGMSGRINEAVTAYRHAIARRPALAEAHSNLSDALRVLGQYDDSISAAREAIRIRPQYPEAFNNLGNALVAAGRTKEGADAYESAVRINPNSAEAWNNLGNARAALGLNDEAGEAYQSAVRLRPDFAEALSNLGNWLKDAGRLEEAVECYRKAIAAKPEIVEIHNNLANALRELGEPQAAMATFQNAVELRPDFQTAWNNLLFTSQFLPSLDGRAILEQHVRWARGFAELLTQAAAPHDNDRNPDRRLRIGYVSPDLRDHPVGRFLVPLLTAHDRERFEIFCYADIARADAVTEKLRASCDHWHETLRMRDDALAAKIKADRVDILVDLALHSAYNRMLVFARRPAPVQCTYLGYPGTTGMTAMRWRLTDRFLDPPDEDRPFYTERSMYLDTTYWCYPPPDFATLVTPLPMLSNRHVTFGCFNAFAKVSADALHAWAKLLERVPGSRLMLHAHHGPHREKVRERFRARGIADDRLEFVGRLTPAHYFANFHKIDISLDPFPYNGGTTTLDSLWMGVPVVSLAGDVAVRRSGLSILSRVGLADLVARGVEAYLEIAAKLASDQGRLLELRSSLRDRMRGSPLMDAPSFARDVERCYRSMWKQWCAS